MVYYFDEYFSHSTFRALVPEIGITSFTKGCISFQYIDFHVQKKTILNISPFLIQVLI